METKSYLWGAFKTTSSPISAASPTSSKKASGIIMQLTKEFTDRSRADIQKWRSAIDAAMNPETPRWQLLQDLIDNLMTDGHLMSQIDIRKSAVLSKRFYIRDAAGKEDEVKTNLLNEEWFFNLVEHILDTPFKGFTVLELTNPVTMEWELVPRRNVIPQQKFILFEVGGEKGVKYDDPSFARTIIYTHSIRLLGILNDIMPQLIWKRNAQQTWADFSERFGIPLVTAETTKTDTKELANIESMLRSLGQAAQAVLPEGTKITIHDTSTKGDPHAVFDGQIKVTNEEMSKRIVGGTMVTDSGSSRSQSEVHERTLDDKIAMADRRLLEFTITKKLLPILMAWGFPFAEGDRFVFDGTEDLSMTDHWTIIKDAAAIYDIPDEWVSKRFNFPINGRIAKAVTPPNTPPTKPKALASNFQ